MRLTRLALGASCAFAFCACSFLTDTGNLVGAGEASAPDVSTMETSVEASTSDVQADTADASDGNVRDPSLVGEWLFDESGTTGNPKDTSGHGNDGRLIGPGTNLAPNGIRGGALEVVEGESMLVESLGGASFPKTGTVMFYVHFDGQPVDTGLGIFDDYDSARDHFFVRILPPARRLQIAVQRGQIYDWLAEYDVPLDEWFHVAVTWTATEATFMFNGGTLQQKAIVNGAFDPSEQIARFGGGMNGRLDEVRLFARPLTSKEVDAYR